MFEVQIAKSTFDEFDRLSKMFKGAERLIVIDEMERAMEEAVEDLRTATIGQIDSEGITNTGTLKRAFYPELRGHGAQLKGVVVNPMEYALPVELGTKPHTPPLDAIKRWAQLKLGLSGKELRRAAGAIWATIRRKGTEAHPFAEDAIERAEPTIQNRFEQGLDRIAHRLAKD